MMLFFISLIAEPLVYFPVSQGKKLPLQNMLFYCSPKSFAPYIVVNTVPATHGKMSITVANMYEDWYNVLQLLSQLEDSQYSGSGWRMKVTSRQMVADVKVAAASEVMRAAANGMRPKQSVRGIHKKKRFPALCS